MSRRCGDPSIRPTGSAYINEWTLEEAIDRALLRLGPVIAIGRPGETIPPAGVAREYLPDNAWRDRVTQYITEAMLVVVILGEGEGLSFEYRTLADMDVLGKVVIVFPPIRADALERRWHVFREATLAEGAAPEIIDINRTVLATFTSKDEMHLITCLSRTDEDDYRLALLACLAHRANGGRAAGIV